MNVALHQSSIDDSLRAMEFLEQSNFDVLEMKVHVLSGLVLAIVSDYELSIEKLFNDRAAKANDHHFAEFIRQTIHQKFRSPDINKITMTLGRFGDDYRLAFASILNTPEHAAWDNLLRARHAIVHRQGILQMTLRDLRDELPRTVAIYARLREVLG